VRRTTQKWHSEKRRAHHGIAKNLKNDQNEDVGMVKGGNKRRIAGKSTGSTGLGKVSLTVGNESGVGRGSRMKSREKRTP